MDKISRTELLSVILETIHDGIISMDSLGTVLSVNPALATIFGYLAEEVVGQNVKMLMPEPYRSRHDGHLSRYNSGGKAAIIGVGRDVVGLRRDGTTFPMHITVTEAEVKGEKIFIGAIQDQTTEKRAEDAVLEKEELYKSLVELTSDWIWEMGPDLRYAFVSERFFEESGFKPQDIIGKTRTEFVGDKTISMNPEIWRAHEEDLKHHRPFKNFEYFQEDQDGQRRYVSASANPFFNEKEEFLGYRGSARDITSRKIIELALRDSEAAYRQAERIALIHYWVSDATFENWVSGSENTGNVLGLPKSDLIGKHSKFLSHIHPDDRERLTTSYNDLKNNPKSFDLEYRFCRPDGVVLYFREVGEPAFDDQGKVTHFFGTTQDITVLKQHEEDLIIAKDIAEAANQTKSDFLANMSHELRTPLNAILGFSEGIQLEIFGSIGEKKYAEYANHIHESGLHLLDMIGNILDFSAIDSGNLDLVFEEVGLSTLVDGSIMMLRNRAEKKRVNLFSEVGKNTPFLSADRVRIKQILINLISNAVKFTLERGEVTVRAGIDEQGRMVVTVSDTGIGMDEEGITKAMLPFSQVKTSSSPKSEGTGLGLPITKRLVEAHGGTFEIKSAKDKGTTVTVTFPRERVIQNVC